MAYIHESNWVVSDQNGMFRNYYDTEALAIAAAEAFVHNNPDCQIFFTFAVTKVTEDSSGL